MIGWCSRAAGRVSRAMRCARCCADIPNKCIRGSNLEDCPSLGYGKHQVRHHCTPYAGTVTLSQI